MSDVLTPIAIPLKPWFQDHRFGDRSVLPAVETMLLLAAAAKRFAPGLGQRIMEEVRFPGFLEVPPNAENLDGFVDCRQESDGQLRIKLLSRVRLKTMTRLKEHGEILFLPERETIDEAAPLFSPDFDSEPLTVVSAERIYRELVPFGPNYRTVQGELFLAGRRAWGHLRAPELPAEPIQRILGSPFPLDGAMHAACVLGQQSVDFIPFPVGFARRVINRPTVPGGSYLTRVLEVDRTEEELCFHLQIFDAYERLCESVTGLRMRNVSGTRK